MSGTTETDIWTVKELVASLSEANLQSSSKPHVRIPSFQRPVVWNRSKQEALIKSVLEGFPIGSLLLWHDPQDLKSFLLVDGQQRSVTLKKHAEADLDFLTEDAMRASPTISAAMLGLHSAVRESNPDVACSIEEIYTEVLKWLLDIKTTSAPQYHSLALLKSLSGSGARFDQNIPIIGDSAHHLLRAIADATDVANISIPVLIYTGPESDLDEIFVKLNEQGVPLNKYQVWAARWAKTQVPNPGQQVLAEQNARLNSMKAQGLQYQDEGPSDSVNLFEYLNAFGHILSRDFPELFSGVAHPKEQSYGFSIALLYFDLSLARKSAEELPAKIESYGSLAMSDFARNVSVSCKILKKTLMSLAALRLTDTQKKLPHPDLQIIPLVAWLARESRSGRSIEEGALLDAIGAQYILDLLLDSFRGPGDTLAHERVQKVDNSKIPSFYRSKPDRNDIALAFEQWISKDRRNVKKRRPITEEPLKKLLLRLISSRHVTVKEQSVTEFDVDHIIPISSPIFKDDNIASEDLAPHAFGNLCLLDEKLNSKKSTRELSQFLTTISEGDKEFVIRAGRLEGSLQNGQLDAHVNATSFIEGTMARSAVLKNELLDALKYTLSKDPL